MQQNINRVASGLQSWKQKELRFSEIFSPSILKDKAFLEQKLSFYDHLQKSYGKSADPEEKLTLQILARHSSQLRKELYPNLLQRVLKKVIQSLKAQSQQRKEQRKTQGNLSALSATVTKAGFGNITSELSKQLQKDQQHFELPVSHYVNRSQKMDYNLSFSKDENGMFQLTKYQAALQNENSKEPIRRQTFPADISTRQAKNLLEGRAIYQQRNDQHGITNTGKWIQLDFNDKDAVGNHRLKEFAQEFNYDIQKELSKLNLKETGSENGYTQLVEDLKNGSKRWITIDSGGQKTKVSIEANPQFKTLNIYDQNNQRITSAQALNGSKKTLSTEANQKQDIKSNHAKRKGARI